MVLKLAGVAMDSKSKVKSAANRFFFVTDFFAVTRFLFVTRFFCAEKLFSVARFFFVTGTIVPIPIPCVPSFLWKPACFLFARRCGRGVRTQMQNGGGCRGELLVAGSECVQ